MCDNGGQIAQSTENPNGNLRVPVLSLGMAVHFTNPLVTNVDPGPHLVA